MPPLSQNRVTPIQPIPTLFHPFYSEGKWNRSYMYVLYTGICLGIWIQEFAPIYREYVLSCIPLRLFNSLNTIPRTTLYWDRDKLIFSLFFDVFVFRRARSKKPPVVNCCRSLNRNYAGWTLRGVPWGHLLTTPTLQRLWSAGVKASGRRLSKPEGRDRVTPHFEKLSLRPIFQLIPQYLRVFWKIMSSEILQCVQCGCDVDWIVSGLY